MSAPHDSRDSANSTTSRLIFGLLAGNLLAVLYVGAFRSSAGPIGIGNEDDLVVAVGVMSLVAAGLLFLASAMPRRSGPWWSVAIALNVTQFAPAVVATPKLGTGPVSSGRWRSCRSSARRSGRRVAKCARGRRSLALAPGVRRTPDSGVPKADGALAGSGVLYGWSPGSSAR